MSHYASIVNGSVVSQSEPARSNQVKNNASGYVFKLDPWQQFDRFLILGQEGPTYYASEKKIVKDNVNVLQACLELDGIRVVDRIVEMSVSGRAPKNDPAIFCLAQAAGSKDPKVRAYALQALPKVCRIGTHLFSFAEDVKTTRRWGRGLRNAVSSWYTDKDANSLALQVMKYQQRNGWSHRDLLRLCHATATSPEMNATFRWVVGGKDAVSNAEKKGGDLSAHLHQLLQAYDEAQRTEDEGQLIKLIGEHNLPREAIPTNWLNSVEVWNALLPHMGLTAMIRNLGKMTALGLLKPLSEASKHVRDSFNNQDRIRKERVHPIQFLLASGIYGQGHGDKGKLTWNPDRSVVDALDGGFYSSFATIDPTGKNMLLALDVSGSMHTGLIAGAPGVTPRKAAAAMAMVTARTEKNCHLVGFTAPAGRVGRGSYGGRWGGGEPTLTPLDISPKDTLDTVMTKMAALPMGGTDCALPMVYAEKNKLDVDVFHVYTDNETWAGELHPFQALKNFRRSSGRDAKLCVVGMEATEFTIADPSDAGMMDVVGFDSHAPMLMADFARGKL